MKDAFIRIYQAIRREGADELLHWLQTTDFFTAPASTRYHGAHEGGLAAHSVEVYRRLRHLLRAEYGDTLPYTDETIALCGLLHDVCKADFYTVSWRNAKDEQTGRWERVPYYTVDDRLPYGHGEKSVYIVREFLPLSREEAMAIRWHMGGFDDAAKGGSPALSAAFTRYPLALLLHLADMQATYLDEAAAQAGAERGQRPPDELPPM